MLAVALGIVCSTNSLITRCQSAKVRVDREPEQ
jgi:hypothetical protein